MNMDELFDEKEDQIRNAFKEATDAMEKQSEDFWNSLTKEQQLDAFCAVVRRIYQGELIEHGSYRYVLYNVFEFGPEAYVPAQMAGYLGVHNAIMPDDYDERLLTKFGQFMGLTKEEAQKKYMDFLMKNC